MKSLDYNLNTSGANILSSAIVLAGDTTGSTVQMNFNGGTAFSCGIGAYSDVDQATSYTCLVPEAERSTSALSSTGIVVN